MSALTQVKPVLRTSVFKAANQTTVLLPRRISPTVEVVQDPSFKNAKIHIEHFNNGLRYARLYVDGQERQDPRFDVNSFTDPTYPAGHLASGVPKALIGHNIGRATILDDLTLLDDELRSHVTTKHVLEDRSTYPRKQREISVSYEITSSALYTFLYEAKPVKLGYSQEKEDLFIKFLANRDGVYIGFQQAVSYYSGNTTLFTFGLDGRFKMVEANGIGHLDVAKNFRATHQPDSAQSRELSMAFFGIDITKAVLDIARGIENLVSSVLAKVEPDIKKLRFAL